MSEYAVYLMTALGLTVTLVGVTTGPGVWVRERILRRGLDVAIGHKRAYALLECGICVSAWTGLAVGVIASAVTGQWLPALTLWLSAPFAFWLSLRVGAGRKADSFTAEGAEARRKAEERRAAEQQSGRAGAGCRIPDA